MSNTDPVALVDSLDPVAIRAELETLRSRESALRVLLRSAVARQRHRTQVMVPTIQARPSGGKEAGRGR